MKSLMLWGTEDNPQFTQTNNPLPVQSIPLNTSDVIRRKVIIGDEPKLIFEANNNRQNAIIQIVDAVSLWLSFDGVEEVEDNEDFYEVVGKYNFNMLKDLCVVTNLAVYGKIADGGEAITIHTLEFS
jgi:hypothetical protein